MKIIILSSPSSIHLPIISILLPSRITQILYTTTRYIFIHPHFPPSQSILNAPHKLINLQQQQYLSPQLIQYLHNLFLPLLSMMQNHSLIRTWVQIEYISLFRFQLVSGPAGEHTTQECTILGSHLPRSIQIHLLVIQDQTQPKFIIASLQFLIQLLIEPMIQYNQLVFFFPIFSDQ